MIEPGATFEENLRALPPIDGIDRIELRDQAGAIVATIDNLPGKRGSLAVYAYLKQEFGTLDAQAAAHGLRVFAEHRDDAHNRPGAHPNVDRLLAIAEGGEALEIDLVAARD